jgi:hypothetical protein
VEGKLNPANCGAFDAALNGAMFQADPPYTWPFLLTASGSLGVM